MSLHSDINERFARIHADKADCVTLTPGALAGAVCAEYGTDGLDPHMSYLALEHAKHMARKFLARQHEPDGEDNPAHVGEQGEFFSGELQTRYPIPRAKGEDAQYKLREHLSDDEARWVLRMLQRKSVGFALHADAFEAWMADRSANRAA